MIVESRPGYYPVIMLPFGLKAALEASPPAVLKPEQSAIPPAPAKVSTFNFGLIVLGGGLLLSSVSEMGIVGIGFGIILIIIHHIYIQAAKRIYARDLYAYTGALQAAEEYPGKLQRYHLQITQYNAPEYAEQFRRGQIVKALASATKPVSMSAMQQLTIKKGSSEARFCQHLINYFGANSIYTSLCLPINYGSYDKNYYPDFTYCHPSGLQIDIEVDEPYAGISKEPIHYQGQDAQRNKYFTERGWVVVRFAEQQIVEQPILCCQFLAQIIAQIVPFQLNYPLAGGTLTSVPQWTMQQAKDMAHRNMRELYSINFAS